MKHSSSNPYAFTEQGISILSAVLKSDIVIEVSRNTKIYTNLIKKHWNLRLGGYNDYKIIEGGCYRCSIIN